MGALGLKEIELQSRKHLQILLCQTSLPGDLSAAWCLHLPLSVCQESQQEGSSFLSLPSFSISEAV